MPGDTKNCIPEKTVAKSKMFSNSRVLSRFNTRTTTPVKLIGFTILF